MNHLQKFDFKGHEIRTLIKKDQPWWVASDVCGYLEIDTSLAVNGRMRINQYGESYRSGGLDEDQKDTAVVSTPSGTQEMLVVSEAGLYALIFNSRKPEAKLFRRWVTNDVLPTIRKHGAYMTPETIERTLTDPDFIIGLATQLKHANEEKERLAFQIEQDKPYTAFGKVVAGSDAAINIGAFAKLMYEKHGVKLGRNRLFEWLRDKGYLIKSGREKNNPKQIYIEQGLFEVRPTIVSRTQGDVERLTPLVTGKGQVRLAEILISEFAAEGVS